MVTPHGPFKKFVHGDAALAEAFNTSVSTVRTWRLKRLVPYVKTGHKSIVYDVAKVMAALEALEVRVVTAKGGR